MLGRSERRQIRLPDKKTCPATWQATYTIYFFFYQVTDQKFHYETRSTNRFYPRGTARVQGLDTAGGGRDRAIGGCGGRTAIDGGRRPRGGCQETTTKEPRSGRQLVRFSTALLQAPRAVRKERERERNVARAATPAAQENAITNNAQPLPATTPPRHHHHSTQKQKFHHKRGGLGAGGADELRSNRRLLVNAPFNHRAHASSALAA